MLRKGNCDLSVHFTFSLQSNWFLSKNDRGSVFQKCSYFIKVTKITFILVKPLELSQFNWKRQSNLLWTQIIKELRCNFTRNDEPYAWLAPSLFIHFTTLLSFNSFEMYKKSFNLCLSFHPSRDKQYIVFENVLNFWHPSMHNRLNINWFRWKKWFGKNAQLL